MTDTAGTETAAAGDRHVSGRVSVAPAEFRLVKYDPIEIAAIVGELADRLGVVNPIHVDVDETTPLAKMSATVDAPTSDAVITIRVQSGALEDTQRFTHFSADHTRESLGRMLLRARDRLRPDFAGVPDDLELALAQLAAWDAYAAGRLDRLGVPVNQQRFRYNFRNRWGFSDTIDARFEELWAADDLGWDELTAS